MPTIASAGIHDPTMRVMGIASEIGRRAAGAPTHRRDPTRSADPTPTSQNQLRRLAQNAGELQCEYARDRLEVCVVERKWHNGSHRLEGRRVKDCRALEAGPETAGVHNAVIAVLVCPGGHGLCESALGSAHAAKVYIGKAELVQSGPEGSPKCLEG